MSCLYKLIGTLKVIKALLSAGFNLVSPAHLIQAIDSCWVSSQSNVHKVSQGHTCQKCSLYAHMSLVLPLSNSVVVYNYLAQNAPFLQFPLSQLHHFAEVHKKLYTKQLFHSLREIQQKGQEFLHKLHVSIILSTSILSYPFDLYIMMIFYFSFKDLNLRWYPYREKSTVKVMKYLITIHRSYIKTDHRCQYELNLSFINYDQLHPY